MLRNRIFFGVAPLIILLMATGGYAVWLFVRLGGAVNTTLHENYVSIVAMRDLKDAALRIETTWSAYKAGAISSQQTRSSLDEQMAVCRRSVDTELSIITEPGEHDAAVRLKGLDEAFLAVVTTLPQNTQAEAELQPALAELLAAGERVAGINEGAMRAKDERARATARASTRVMLVAMAASLPLGLFFAYRLGGTVLRPLERLTDSARELGEGNLDQVLPLSGRPRDELGQLAHAFNQMAGKLRRYRQSTRDALRHARQATEIVFAALPEPLAIFSAEGALAYQNPAAERLQKKLASTGAAALPLEALAARVLQGGGDYLPESFEPSICVRVDGREKFLLPRVIGLGEGGAGAVVILHDVTRFRLLDDVKTHLVATVSHELKTPLTSLRMAVYLLLEERVGALNAKQTELLVASRDDAERLLELINNLLDLARLESGAAVSERRVQRPEELVRRAAEAAREGVYVAGLRLAVRVGEGLPAVAQAGEQLGHVFSNLISNAAKHSPPGEEITLGARAQAGGGAVRFSVTDRGPGVPEAERERVFEKFYRLPGETREGAGLGLAICREIVRAHEGHIGVTTAPGGQGSEFFFVLPAAS